MTHGNNEVDPDDATAIAEYDEAHRDFTTELNRLHIAYGAPSYATLAKASVRPKLTKAGLNELLSGKRLPSQETLLEFVRVVSNPLPPPEAPATYRAKPDLCDIWRTRWQHVKLLQRQAQNPWKRVRATAQQALGEALQEAAEIRAAAHTEAAQICADAQHEAENMVKQAEATVTAEVQEALAVSSAQAARLHSETRETADRVRGEAQAAAERLATEASETLVAAQEEAVRRRSDAEELLNAARKRLDDAHAEAERICADAQKEAVTSKALAKGLLNLTPTGVLSEIREEVRRQKERWIDEQNFASAAAMRDGEKLFVQAKFVLERESVTIIGALDSVSANIGLAKERWIEEQDFESAARMRDVEKRLLQVKSVLEKEGLNAISALNAGLIVVSRTNEHNANKQSAARMRDVEKRLLQAKGILRKKLGAGTLTN